MGPSSELQEGKLAFVYSACVAAVFCSDPTLHMTAEKQQPMAVPSREAKRGSLHRTSQAIQLAIVGFLSQTHAVGCLLTASPIDKGTAVDVQGLMVRSTWSRALRFTAAAARSGIAH